MWVQARTAHLRAAAVSMVANACLNSAAAVGVLHGGGFGGGHRPVGQVQVRDAGDPRVAPVPQLGVGVPGADEVAVDVSLIPMSG